VNSRFSCAYSEN